MSGPGFAGGSVFVGGVVDVLGVVVDVVDVVDVLGVVSPGVVGRVFFGGRVPLAGTVVVVSVVGCTTTASSTRGVSGVPKIGTSTGWTTVVGVGVVVGDAGVDSIAGTVREAASSSRDRSAHHVPVPPSAKRPSPPTSTPSSIVSRLDAGARRRSAALDSDSSSTRDAAAVDAADALVRG